MHYYTIESIQSNSENLYELKCNGSSPWEEFYTLCERHSDADVHGRLLHMMEYALSPATQLAAGRMRKIKGTTYDIWEFKRGVYRVYVWKRRHDCLVIIRCGRKATQARDIIHASHVIRAYINQEVSDG